jgi:HAD superfamily hydrolase (TIGR01509 family)
VRQDKAQFYWDLISHRQASFFKEVPKILELLKEYQLTNVIVSNSSAQEIQCILAQNNQVAQLIDDVVGLEPGMRKKPAPDLYLKALDVLKLTAAEVLIIEDSERGLWAAEKSGCEAIWIKTELNKNLKTQAPFFKELTHQQFFETIKK